VNSASIGIEIVNPGHEFGYREFPQPQMDAVLELSKGILSRHNIAPRDVIGHADLAPERKEDPGELFPWAWLAQQGVGLWYGELSVVSRQLSVGGASLGQESRTACPRSPERGEAASPLKNPVGFFRDNQITSQRKLAEYGYGITPSGVWDEASQAVVRAFQRHFRQEKVDGLWDEHCSNLLDKLLEKL
jgi:N-acetylmuramoyl-L-alanine amidase